MPDQVHIEGNEAIATSPEDQTARMPLEALLARVAPQRMATGGVILPAGMKAILPEGVLTIWVHESPPRTYHLQWIADDSPAPFGKGTKYRHVRLALPYVVMLAVFGPGPGGRLQLLSSNECFFRIKPLRSLDDELFYPALLNCSRFEPQEGRPLSWICTQYLNLARLAAEPDQDKRMCASFDALRHCLLETGFNYSSENHEASSWFTESRKCDERVRTVDKWQEASARDPLFVLDVPWLKTGHSVRQVAARIAKNLGIHKPEFNTAASLARVIFNQQPRKPARRPNEDLQELMHALGI